ncbi:glycosyl hydrolase [Xylogone sp. PMI_703]|nr:glycosyl hydrolase [Xylogone sp. PMI_703]
MSLESANKGKCFPRPKVHITDSCWINDPCAPTYDPASGYYHLYYQCNPHGCEWGNMSWGHVISKDLIHWTRPSTKLALRPDQEYDKDGVFTGCSVPQPNKEISDRGSKLTVFYSSVRRLPFHWSTPPYPRNAAGMAMAFSNDKGKTWTKSPENPILEGEPETVAVTGFRDPFIESWPVVDEIRGRRSLYGIISGGIQNAGPTTFLYAIEPEDLGRWIYLCPLIDLVERFHPSPKWSGNYGLNWECTNFMTLSSGPISRHCLILGAEGDAEREHIKQFPMMPDMPVRTVRSQLWMFGNFDLSNKAKGQVKFHYNKGGYLDHGSYYAANSFLDPKSDRRIVYGWIPEDASLSYCQRKGWNGCFALPREVFLARIPQVTRALKSELSEISCVDIVSQDNDCYDLYTLGIRLIDELVTFRERSLRTHRLQDISLPRTGLRECPVCAVSSITWELETRVTLDRRSGTVGFSIRNLSGTSAQTTITFSLADEIIVVDRQASNSNMHINRCPDKGPFTLFFQKDGGGEETLEKLYLHIIFDGDVLEIFANNRFALATMVYADGYMGEREIIAFADGSGNSAVFDEVSVWDGLNNLENVVIEQGKDT